MPNINIKKKDNVPDNKKTIKKGIEYSWYITWPNQAIDKPTTTWIKIYLKIKSIIGLVFTIFASLYAIPKWGILGACLVTSVSYCLTAIILFWKFYQDTKFSIHDFILSETETRLLLQSLKNKFKS